MGAASSHPTGRRGSRRGSRSVLASFEISPSTVADKIARGEDFILVDVRRSEEYAAAHLKGARLLPVEELSAASLAHIGLGSDRKDKKIIVYCRSGVRSKTAYDIMTSLGYHNVKSIAGGMLRWTKERHPFIET